MKEYIKIETVFERDTEGTRKLIEGKFRDETVEYLRNNAWEWTEKIDGTNIGVIWDGDHVSFQGRTEKAQIPAYLLTVLNEIFGSEEAEELFEQIFDDKTVILYGEGFGRKIQKNGALYLPDGVGFILFDVYFPETNLWLKRDAVEKTAQTFGIPCVPIVFYGDIEKAVEYVKTNPHSLIGEAPMEGLVGRPLIGLTDRLGKRVIVKIKAVDFQQNV